MSSIEQFYSLFAEQLEVPTKDTNRAVRALEALDGLLLFGSEANQFCRSVLSTEPCLENVGAALILGSASGDTKLMEDVLMMTPKSSEVWNGVRLGLRLGRLSLVRAALDEYLNGADEWGSVAVLDAILFHRLAFDFDPQSLLQHDDPELRVVAVEALGRSPVAKHSALVFELLNDSDPIVRRSALAAAARLGLSELNQKCRSMAVANDACLSAVRFLGILATTYDIPLVNRLAAREETAAAACEAMGKNGLCEFIPGLLRALRSPKTADAAARALERVTGRLVPRQDPPPPPDHLTEDELDFWFHPGDPIPEVADQWWQRNHYYFEPGERYQAGVCISEDPLGSHFDQLPDEVRTDLYLRERMLNPASTPDWELETWPQYVRNPAWASQA